MLISSLLYHTGYNEQLFKPNLLGGCLCSSTNGVMSRSATPSISKLQQHIEWAWRQGFDAQGCDQLGGKLYNTRKWIGATEVVIVLSSLRIRYIFVIFLSLSSSEAFITFKPIFQVSVNRFRPSDRCGRISSRTFQLGSRIFSKIRRF